MAAQHYRYGDYSTRYRFNGKEQDEATGFYYYGTRYYEPNLSRWLSTDPLAEKYQGFSPYNFTLNNTVRLVDFDGRSVDDIVIRGKEKKKAFAELQKAVKNSVKLKMDKSGVLSYKIKKGTVPTYNQQKLLTAIDDNCVLTVLNTTKKSIYLGKLFVGGGFFGNTIMKNGDYDITTNQVVNPYVLDKLSSSYDLLGRDMLHEALESYEGALISLKNGHSSPFAGYQGSVYNDAHNLSIPQSGRITAHYYTKEGYRIHGSYDPIRLAVLGGDTKNYFGASEVNYIGGNGALILRVK